MKYKLIGVGLLMASMSAVATEFSWDNLMLAHSKLDKVFDYETHVDSYMRKYRGAVWDKYRNDEFELEDKRQETIQIMKDRIASFDLKEEFTIRTSFDFGEYNFKKEEFSLSALSESTYYYENSSGYGTFPYTYKVFFNNYDVVGDLKMSKEEAREFLKSKKNRYGDVNRTVPAKVTFNIVGLGSGNGELRAEVKEVIVYKDKDKKTELARF